jgi:hypothetical protein
MRTDLRSMMNERDYWPAVGIKDIEISGLIPIQ